MPFLRLVGCLLFLAIAGCSDDLQIRQYKIPKPTGTVATGEKVPQEMIAAIIPDATSAWFFKLSGNPEQVKSLEADFRKLVKSFKLDEGGIPKWELPTGWKQTESTNSFSYANLLPPDAQELKSTVSQLPMPSGELSSVDESTWRAYVVENVNRWRGQLTLPKQNWEEMAPGLETIQELSKEPAKAYLVSLQGSATSGGGGPMMGSGMMGGAPKSAPPPSSGERASSASPRDVQFTLPTGWVELDQPLSMMAVRSLEAKSADGAVAKVTFTPAGGDPESNVARWQGQIQPNAPPAQLQKALDGAVVVPCNSVEAKVYMVTHSESGEHEAICGAIVPWSPQVSLFIKMYGPSAAVEANREGFLQLVKSLKW